MLSFVCSIAALTFLLLALGFIAIGFKNDSQSKNPGWFAAVGIVIGLFCFWIAAGFAWFGGLV